MEIRSEGLDRNCYLQYKDQRKVKQVLGYYYIVEEISKNKYIAFIDTSGKLNYYINSKQVYSKLLDVQSCDDLMAVFYQ